MQILFRRARTRKGIPASYQGQEADLLILGNVQGMEHFDST